MKRIWVKTQNGEVFPAKTNLQTVVSDQHGLIIIAYVNPYEPITAKKFHSKAENANILLADETGYIINSNMHFRQNYLSQYSGYVIEDSRVNVNSIFPDIEDIPESVLAEGVMTRFTPNFGQSDYYIEGGD